MSATVGRDLRLVGTKYEYELVAGDDRAGTISLLGKFWLAHMACREGDSFLTRRRKHGWGFVIEAEGRSQVGRYSGGRWRAGGTILMATGTRVDLRHTLSGGWSLQTPNSRPFAAISRRLDLEGNKARGYDPVAPHGRRGPSYRASHGVCGCVAGWHGPWRGPVGGVA